MDSSAQNELVEDAAVRLLEATGSLWPTRSELARCRAAAAEIVPIIRQRGDSLMALRICADVLARHDVWIWRGWDRPLRDISCRL